MTHPIRVGVVGANPDHSWASYTHLPALQALPQFDLKAVSTTRRETADRAAQRFGASLAFDDAFDLVTHPGIDVVTVAVKVPQHRELVLAALQAGKHVYCEWPLGNGLEQSVELAEAARQQRVHTTVGLQGRASPWIDAIRNMVADGKLGRILSTSVVASGHVFGPNTTSGSAYTLDRRNGATLLTMSFAHLLDAVLHTLGEADELSSLLATQRREIHLTDTDETALLLAADQILVNGVLASGAVASLHMRGGLSRGTNLLWEINGSEGDLVVTADTPFPHFGPLRLKLGSGAASTLEEVLVADDVPDVPSSLKGGPAYNIACLYARFARDIQEDIYLCPGFDEAVYRHGTLDAIEKASAEGRRVHIAKRSATTRKA
jgi:predicted dehydrogenase